MSYARAVDESNSAFLSIPCVVIDVRVLKTVSLGNVLSIDHVRVLIESCEWTESIGEGTSVTRRLSMAIYRSLCFRRIERRWRYGDDCSPKITWISATATTTTVCAETVRHINQTLSSSHDVRHSLHVFKKGFPLRLWQAQKSEHGFVSDIIFDGLRVLSRGQNSKKNDTSRH